MCGRYILLTGDDNKRVRRIKELAKEKYHTDIKKGDIYPSDVAPVFICNSKCGKMELDLMQWGYEKHFDNKGLIINARSETVFEKQMFSDDFKNRRCLIPAVGFYEWNARKEKFLFSQNSQLLYFGGIYHQRPEGSCQFLIITRPASEVVLKVHQRMPVIVPEGDYKSWFKSPETAQKLMVETEPELDKKSMDTEKQINMLN